MAMVNMIGLDGILTDIPLDFASLQLLVKQISMFL